MKLLDRAIGVLLPAVPKPIVRRFSSRYIAGSSVADAFRVARAMAEQGALCTLDILGEFIESAEEARANTAAHEDLVRRIAADDVRGTNVSIKLTALGLLLDETLCANNLRRIVAVARETGNFIRIDMEDARCTDATLRVYRVLRREFPDHVGVVLQARLRRTLRDIDELCAEPASFRLCKGIYLEPRPIAFTDAEVIRRNFVLALDLMLRKGAYVGIATHDEILVWEALRLVREHALAPDRYEFQMLLGVDEELRRILIEDGHRLRVYVPFGERWYPYSVRRLRENPQIAGYALRALLRRR